MVTCCRNCTKRHIRCHSTCEIYINTVADADRVKAEKIKRYNSLQYDYERAVKINERIRKKKKA